MNSFIKQFPNLKGSLQADVRLADMTWFGVGGNADFLFNPKDAEDIAYFLRFNTMPVTMLGGCSNVLIRDGGIIGCVMLLGKNFSEIKVDNNTIYCGCGALNSAVAKVAMDNAIGGFEFLHDIPGTVGGAVRGNAGANGGEIKDILTSLSGVDTKGNIFTVSADEMNFEYRLCKAPKDWIFTEVALQGYAKPQEEIQQNLSSYREKRKQSQPIGVKTAGSTFKNPQGHAAWKLIETAGCRGMKIGGAEISEKHCNFLVNTGGASAADIENLGEAIREKVLQTHNISL